MSSTDQNKQVAQNFIHVVWREGRLDRLGKLWAQDCINHAAAAGEERGLAALRAYHEGFGAAFTDMRIDLRQQVVEADRVVTHNLATVSHVGSFMYE